MLYFSRFYDCVAIFGVRRLDCALVYDGLFRHSILATAEVVSLSYLYLFAPPNLKAVSSHRTPKIRFPLRQGFEGQAAHQ
jgi:hypothetical protein